MKKITVWISSILILLVCVSFLLLPTFFSSDSGKKQLVDFINHRINGQMAVQNLKLSWLGKQTLENFQLYDAAGTRIVNIPFLETETSLFYLLFGGRNLKDTVIKSPYLFIEEKEKGETNLKKALSEKKEKKKAKKQGTQPTFSQRLRISDGTVILSSSKIKPVTVSNLNVEKQDEPNAFFISANTQQGAVSGSLRFNAVLVDKALQIQADIKDFPVAVLDQYYESPLFSEGIGQTLNASFNLNKEEALIKVDGNVESAHLKAHVKGDTRDHKFYIYPDTELKFTLTPSFFKALLEPSQKEKWRLGANADLNVHIEKGVFPLNMDTSNFQASILQATANLERAELNHVTLGSYSLNNFNASVVMLGNLEIAYSGQIKGKETTAIDGTVSITPDKKVLFNYNTKGFPVRVIEPFSPKVSEILQSLLGQTFDLKGKGTYIDKQLNTDFSVDAPALQLQGNLNGVCPDFGFTLSGKSALFGEKAKILGPSLDFTFEGDLNLDNDQVSVPLFTGKLSNDYVDVDLRGKMGEKRKPFALDQIHLVASGTIKQIGSYEKFPAKDGLLFVHVDGSRNLLTGKTSFSVNNGSLELNFETENFIHENFIDFKEAQTKFNIDLADFPTAMLQPFAADKWKLETLIGPKLTLQAEGFYSPKDKAHALLDLEAAGEGLQGVISLVMKEDTWTISESKPSFIYWDLTPQRYLALIEGFNLDPEKLATYTLVRTAPFELKINHLTCPSKKTKKLAEFLCESGFDGSLRLGPLLFRSKDSQETLTIQEIEGSFNGKELCNEIELKLQAALNPSNLAAKEKSSLSFNGSIFNLCAPDGSFKRNKVSVKGEATVNLLPVKHVLGILPLTEDTRGKIYALLGDFVNARMTGEIAKETGPVMIDLKASNFKTRLPLYFTPTAILLSDTLEAELTLTESVSNLFLRDITPLITAAYSDHPIKVFIDKEGFSFPIHPFQLQAVRIEKGVIDIGKIRVQNGGHIQALMEFLKAKDISDEGVMDAWFTPIFFSFKDGIIRYKRFDALLAGNVHIALWGAINLLNDRVEMTLGIAPTTLKQRFNILGISKKDMFQVKMRGTTEKLDLDWSSAYTRIGILIARTAGGHIGYIIGGIVEQIVNLLGEEPTPEATTYPLPWDSDEVQQPEGIPEETAPPKSHTKKGLKKILEFLIP